MKKIILYLSLILLLVGCSEKVNQDEIRASEVVQTFIDNDFYVHTFPSGSQSLVFNIKNPRFPISETDAYISFSLKADSKSMTTAIYPDSSSKFTVFVTLSSNFVMCDLFDYDTPDNGISCNYYIDKRVIKSDFEIVNENHICYMMYETADNIVQMMFATIDDMNLTVNDLLLPLDYIDAYYD